MCLQIVTSHAVSQLPNAVSQLPNAVSQLPNAVSQLSQVSIVTLFTPQQLQTSTLNQDNDAFMLVRVYYFNKSIYIYIYFLFNVNVLFFSTTKNPEREKLRWLSYHH